MEKWWIWKKKWSYFHRAPPPLKEFRHCSSLHPLILDFQTPLPNLKGEGEGG